MPLYGHEMNEEITPKMAGLPCKLTGKDFIGRDALVALGAPKLKRIGMKVVGRGIVREHCDLYTMEGEKLGWTSSGTFAASRWATSRSSRSRSAGTSTPTCAGA